MDFHSFFGQSRALAELSLSFGRPGGEIAHAYLFTGPEGCGKGTLARICARALLCRGQDRPCGVCPSCGRVREGAHPDYIELEPGGAGARGSRGEIGVPQVRGLLAALAERPFEGGQRAVLLLRDMNAAAQNALLKTLEQPPSDTVFFLTARHISALLPTVVSRSRVVMLGAVPYDDCVRALTNSGVDPARARLLAGLSGGLVGKALAYHSDAEFWRLRDLAYAFFAPELKGRAAELMLLYKDMPAESAPVFLECLENVVSDMLRCFAGARLMAGDKRDVVECIADASTAGQAAGLVDALLSVRERLNSNITWQSAFEPFVFAWSEGNY